MIVKKNCVNFSRKRHFIVALTFLLVITFVFGFLGINHFRECNDSYTAEASTAKTVHLGGMPVGLKLRSDGVTIGGFVPVITANGSVNPAEEAGLKLGDLIIEVGGKSIKTPSDLSEAVKNTSSSVNFKFKRDGKIGTVSVTPIFDPLAGENKIGIMAKNEIAGVGTLTFTEIDGRFCTLGHQISDPNVDDVENYQDGFVYSCSVLGAVKGVKGEAGALKGVFDRNSREIGVISSNSVYGVYGTAVDHALKSGALIEVAGASEVKPGKAHIYSTVEGSSPKRYEIEIVKAIPQNARDTKGLVVRVTDKELLSVTGGIVQGMSGSPIVQNGKLVGALTHVLVDDPVYGYGIYAEWLLN